MSDLSDWRQSVHGYLARKSRDGHWKGFLAALADDTSDPVSFMFRCGIGASAMGTPSQRASLRLQCSEPELRLASAAAAAGGPPIAGLGP